MSLAFKVWNIHNTEKLKCIVKENHLVWKLLSKAVGIASTLHRSPALCICLPLHSLRNTSVLSSKLKFSTLFFLNANFIKGSVTHNLLNNTNETLTYLDLNIQLKVPWFSFLTFPLLHPFIYQAPNSSMTIMNYSI